MFFAQSLTMYASRTCSIDPNVLNSFKVPSAPDQTPNRVTVCLTGLQRHVSLLDSITGIYYHDSAWR